MAEFTGFGWVLDLECFITPYRVGRFLTRLGGGCLGGTIVTSGDQYLTLQGDQFSSWGNKLTGLHIYIQILIPFQVHTAQQFTSLHSVRSQI